MTGSATDCNSWVDKRPPLSLPVACAWLFGTAALTFPIVGVLAAEQFGTAAWVSSAIAAATCTLASAAALCATALSQGPLRGFYCLLYGMLFGFAIPFAAGLTLSQRVPYLANAGVFGLMVVFYLVILVANTLLSVRLMATQGNAGSREARNG